MIVELNQRDDYWEISILSTGPPNPAPVQLLRFDTIDQVFDFYHALQLELGPRPYMMRYHFDHLRTTT